MTLMILLNGHRIMFLLVVALIFWVLAYAIYFRNPAREYLRRGQRHTWKVDMEKKQAVSRGKLQI